MVGEFITLTIKDIKQETAEAVSILFEPPRELQGSFTFKPGQYVTIKWKTADQEYRRSYSISSVPTDPYIAITVKEVTKGKVSPILSRNLKPGDTLEVMFPEGRFTADFHEDKKRMIFLMGAGSGITPLMSLLRTALEIEPKSEVILLYGSRNEAQIIFKKDLDELAERYKGQLSVYHTLSRPGEGGFLKSIFGKKKSDWEGLKGRISPEHIRNVMKQHPSTREPSLFYLCGPGDFIQMAERTLREQGISPDMVRKEFFTPPSSEHPTTHIGESHKHTGKTSTVTVHLRGDTIQIPVADETILDTLLNHGYDAPYSCHSGACATCMAKVLKGEVEMDACFALNDQEIQSGYILTCQSHPTTPEVEVSYDE
jgi:ring-1,2-phenylacetyl-CoA epoxidase subunit PaaE